MLFGSQRKRTSSKKNHQIPQIKPLPQNCQSAIITAYQVGAQALAEKLDNESEQVNNETNEARPLTSTANAI